MGQKTHPTGFRLGVIKTWSSRWYAGRDFGLQVVEDKKIRQYVKKKLEAAGVSQIEIERAANKVKLRIVYDKKTRRVLGAQMASYQDISMGIHMFSLAIEEGVTIDRLKLLDIFFLPHFNQPYNYITMAALSAK